MQNKFLKEIFIVITVFLIHLGGTTAKAMWESLDDTQRSSITNMHNSNYDRIPDYSYNISYWTHRNLNNVIQTLHVNDVKDCALCQREVMAIYCQNLQQQHAATLLEVDGLKDDVQRLKAELRAATEPR